METPPVVLVANKIDQINDRMVSKDEGKRTCMEIGCACFHEISVRESVDEAFGVFQDVCRFWRFFTKFPNLKRSKSDSMRLSMTIHSDAKFGLNSDRILTICSEKQLLSRNGSDAEEKDEFDELEPISNQNMPFRSRAKTDGNLLLNRTKRWKVTSPFINTNMAQCLPEYHFIRRRNSISMRGHVSC
jgi:Ras family